LVQLKQLKALFNQNQNLYFFSDYFDRHRDEFVSRIRLRPGINPATLQIVLIYMYTGELGPKVSPLTLSMAVAVMQCAEELGIRALAERCEKYVIASSRISAFKCRNRALQLLEAASQISLERYERIAQLAGIDHAEFSMLPVPPSPSYHRTRLSNISMKKTGTASLQLLLRTMIWLGKYKHAYRLLNTIDYSHISKEQFKYALSINQVIIEGDQHLCAYLNRIARFFFFCSILVKSD
jgi:hypothetical protein